MRIKWTVGAVTAIRRTSLLTKLLENAIAARPSGPLLCIFVFCALIQNVNSTSIDLMSPAYTRAGLCDMSAFSSPRAGHQH